MSERMDTANEPVDPADDGEFMDTGILHETKCKDPECTLPHPHPKESQ